MLQVHMSTSNVPHTDYDKQLFLALLKDEPQNIWQGACRRTDLNHIRPSIIVLAMQLSLHTAHICHSRFAYMS